MTELEAQRAEIVLGLVGALGRLEKARHFLSLSQRLFVSEELRNLADQLDAGAGDRLQHRLSRRRLSLISETAGFGGRPLFKLL